MMSTVSKKRIRTREIERGIAKQRAQLLLYRYGALFGCCNAFHSINNGYSSSTTCNCCPLRW